MTGGDEPARLVPELRPRFEVDGRLRDNLSESLLRLEASADEEGMARLEARFLNWGVLESAGEPGFVYFDGDTLALGRSIVVSAGEGDAGGDLFRGTITAIEGVYSASEPPEVWVRAEDALQQARMRQHSRLHEDRTDADIATAVARDLSLTADAPVDGPTHRELWQVEQSDLALLRERARAVDARIEVGDGELRFVPRRDPDPPEPIRLTALSELVRFHVAADLAHQRTEVRVHGWSVADKEGIHETADTAAVDAEAGGDATGPGTLGELGLDAAEDVHLDMPLTTDEARTLATARMRQRARRFVRGRGTTDGTPAMRVGSQLELTDLGPWFTGTYHVTEVRHTFDQSVGLRTHFVAERAGLGGDQ